MSEDIRRECTPQDYIRKLFHETKDEKLKIVSGIQIDEIFEEKYGIRRIKVDDKYYFI